MTIQILSRNNYKKSLWTGGTTLQLYIYPENEIFEKYNFLYRISSATIEVKNSTFTPMVGYNRHLMLLNGTMEIAHNFDDWIFMNTYHVDVFKGSDKTVSRSKEAVCDFNLIVKDGLCGQLDYIKLDEDQTMLLDNKDVMVHEIYYVHKGSVEVVPCQNNKISSLGTGELLILVEDCVQIKALTDCVLIKSVIRL